MPGTGTLRLALRDVRHQPIEDTATIVFRRLSDGSPLGRPIRRKFSWIDPTKRSISFKLPAMPDEWALFCEVDPDRYRKRSAASFSLTDGEEVSRNLTVLRTRDDWEPKFTPWADLSAQFDSLKRVLESSPAIDVKNKVANKTGRTIPNYTGADYDAGYGETEARAKTSMLNLFHKLSAANDPVHGKPWFEYVERLLAMDRERIIVVVPQVMRDAVRHIWENMSDFKGQYEWTPGKNHAGNFPGNYDINKNKLFSIKSGENQANFQLTIGEGTDPETGDKAFILDADIDENGEALKHLLDALLVHKITGGTHPNDVHELLVAADPTLDLGYELV